MHRVRTAGRGVIRIISWVTILSFTAALVVSVLIPRLADATPYAVLTGSMQPHHPPGSLVVVRPVPESDIHEGDIITYQLESGKPTVVTHRVIHRSTNLEGQVLFTTQGDANSVADAKPVAHVQIKGKLWYSVPYLGYANTIITGKERDIALAIVVSILLGYSAYMFISAAGVKRKEGKTCRTNGASS
ncbi:conserved hypothetical membrane protein [Glutamicibacter arilaitensis Re117]|uniref:Signal peptidase I n=1 Tax=Glutamicibacter arilaitensis (strain DSM 16368 / CIP 108037 / IAM 15318 / JCM 13566 / NCIMB 14258 / Re117) TaxID=861360 RepID=A0ABP1U535_GLUAR|nr:conserved hypothetical membrane protein [Glutamicibacter arilaitensis Re117]